MTTQRRIIGDASLKALERPGDVKIAEGIVTVNDFNVFAKFEGMGDEASTNLAKLKVEGDFPLCRLLLFFNKNTGDHTFTLSIQGYDSVKTSVDGITAPDASFRILA